MERLALVAEHGRKVISMRFSYKYQYFKICHTSLTGFGWYLLAKYLAALRLLPTASFKYDDCDREALERKMLRHRHIVVSGWHARWYDLFLKYRDEITDLFTLYSQYTDPVKAKMQKVEQGSTGSIVRLGVHIRRGDYRIFHDGKYLYDDEVYQRHIRRFMMLHPGKAIHVYIATNDPEVKESSYQEQCPGAHVHCLGGSSPEDLFMLSECDYLIGPPSTYSLVAAMYRDIPLYRMDETDEGMMTLESFRRFDYWFRRII